ncbi:MAG: phosphoglucosamine mutase [Clostridia bacterium]|nr:phosphoglucosamine mutase [Clostridia bacterium]
MENNKCISNNIQLKDKYTSSNFVGKNSVADSAVLVNSSLENCSIGENVEITNSVLKDCYISAGSKIGTYKAPAAKKMFGTDGIRGVYGQDFDETTAENLAKALCFDKKTKIVVGRDTRESGKVLFDAFKGAVVRFGGQVLDLGITTTPATAFMTKHHKADFGVVITASHNPIEFNGFKVLGADGEKLSQEAERHLESLFEKPLENSETLGKVRKISTKPYEEFVRGIDENKFDGIKILLDCANGGVASLAPVMFEDLHAEVTTVFSSGIINHKCGAVYPENLAKLVVSHKADIGFAFDGDGDRIVAVNSKGQVLDGDDILYILAWYLGSLNQLPSKKVVGTEITNIGIENKLKGLGLDLVRVSVGDKYVKEKMALDGIELGGEQSGHIMLEKYGRSADGLLIARLLTTIFAENKHIFFAVKDNKFMQAHKSIRLERQIASEFFESSEFKSLINFFQGKLAGGRIVVRPSGTEPKLRIMVECRDFVTANIFANEIRKKLMVLLRTINSMNNTQ